MTDEPNLTEKQQRVLAAAMEVFAERGFAGASTAEIAKRAGVAEGTIFKIYKTKKALLIGVVAPLFSRLLAPTLIDPVVQIMKTPHATVEDWLRALYRNRVELLRAHPQLVRIAMQELPFHEEVRDVVKATVLERVWPHARGAIERFQALGLIRSAPPASIMRIVFGTFATYAVTRVFVQPNATVADDGAEIELMADVVARGLRP
jgi:AcrR family transcriptional regulator